LDKYNCLGGRIGARKRKTAFWPILEALIKKPNRTHEKRPWGLSNTNYEVNDTIRRIFLGRIEDPEKF